MGNDSWPVLPAAWKDTYATLHMWTQVVGKVALAQAPPLNHSWGVALQITPRGMATRSLPHGHRTFVIAFDFIDHRLEICASDGMTESIALGPRSVAVFYADVMHTLDEMELPVRIWPMPVEVPNPIRFDEDTAHASYDPVYVQQFWRILVSCERVFSMSRSRFVGKCSPVHFFWGGFDLAVTRFSGRPAPPREGPTFMREAYSHEVISHGFWPGSGPVQEPAFYAYAVPAPPGFDAMPVQPAAAFYHRELGEFILPYEAVRTADDPDRALLQFVDSTYIGGAALAAWNRAALEQPSN
ncbi:MAG TPA: DUF5996 family protein [Vicinamibacterales bacterium]